MAETNARREARRRRILENSESRLRKITASNNGEKIEDNIPSMGNNSVNAKSDLEEYDVRNGSYNNLDNKEELQDYMTFNDDKPERFPNNTNNKNTYLLEQLFSIEFMLSTLLANRINLILLAGIVNILILLKLDHWFGQTVIIPYLILMLGRIYSCKKLETQDSNLLNAALILCNINPNMIHKFKVLVTLFYKILGDFA